MAPLSEATSMEGSIGAGLCDQNLYLALIFLINKQNKTVFKSEILRYFEVELSD